MNTDAVMCIAFTRQSPSCTPLFRTSSSTVSVMFTNPTRPGTSNHKCSVSDFMRHLYHITRLRGTFSRIRLLVAPPHLINILPPPGFWPTVRPLHESKNATVSSHSMSEPLQLKEPTANPAPLGLMGFGMTTVLLNLHNAGAFPLNSMILAMGICYGGVAQIIAGIMEWKKNNTFAATAFISYGFFWLALVALLILPKLNLADAPNGTAMAAYLALWGLFTAVMTIGTFRLSRALQFVFGTLTILFFLLAYADFTGASA